MGALLALQSGAEGARYQPHPHYAELNQAANRLAAELLHRHGLRKGDRVMVVAEHCLEYVTLFVAAQKIGLILVPINYRLAAGEINYMVANCQPALLIYEDQFQ